MSALMDVEYAKINKSLTWCKAQKYSRQSEKKVKIKTRKKISVVSNFQDKVWSYIQRTEKYSDVPLSVHDDEKDCKCCVNAKLFG